MQYPTRVHSIRSLLLAGAVAFTTMLAACAPQRAPVPPPAPQAAPTQLMVHAQRGQSKAQQDRDRVECQSAASARAVSSLEWAQVFGSCMGSRGYLVK